MSTFEAVQDQLNIIASQNLKEKKYWMSRLSGSWEKAVFPFDTQPGPFSDEWMRYEFRMTNELTASVRALSNANLKAANIILISGLMATLWKYSGQADIVIGMPVYEQGAPAETLVNTALPLRMHFTGQTTLRSLLSSVKELIKEGTMHQNYPVKMLVGKPEQTLSEQHDGGLFNVCGLLKQLHNEDYLDNFPHRLRFVFNMLNDHVNYEIVYQDKAYSQSTIQQIARHFECLLAGLLKEPDALISAISPLSPQETEKIGKRLDMTGISYPGKAVITDFFRLCAERFAAQVALVCGNDQLTYEELDKRSDKVAAWLHMQGVGRNEIVALMLERSPEMIIALLGILKAGGAYLPIDPDQPLQRIHYLFGDSQAKWLVTYSTCPAKTGFNGKILLMDQAEWTDELSAGLLPVNHPGDVAYVIYTSGTTGQPKGVMIAHKNVVRLLFNDQPLFDFNETDIWTIFHNYNFDFSVWEIFGALLFGGRLVMVPRLIMRDPSLFLTLLVREKVTILNQTPSAFYLLSTEAKEHAPKPLEIRYVIFGGEALRTSNLRDWATRYPQTRLVNMYGITETTVHVTYKNIRKEEIAGNVSPLGIPIPTLEILLLDPSGNFVPDGVAAEIFVGGEGLAIGYLNNPELTAARFIPHPFRKEKKLYRTGDCARFGPGGLEYLGRLDHQVQLNGYRIELGEIENHLMLHEGIKDAVISLQVTDKGNPFLCAYWIGRQPLKAADIRNFLEKRLPAWMIPGRFIEMDVFPLTENNKIDKAALPVLRRLDREIHVMPRDQMEQEMLEIWQQTLQLKDFGVRDNYFHIGGDSILSIRLLSNVNRRFKTNLRVNDLYTNDTIETLCQIIRGDQAKEKEKNKTRATGQLKEFRETILHNDALPVHGEIEDVFPMSDIQKGMTYYSTIYARQVVYHEQVVIEIKYENLDMTRFCRALELMIDKHIIFRSCFWMEYFAHIVYRKIAYEVPFISLVGKTIEEQKKKVTAFLEEAKKRPFDLEKPPLWRMTFFQLGTNHHILVFELHHAILDGWSQASFFTELNNTYITLKDNPSFVPIKLKITYKEFIAQEVVNKSNEATIQFWKQELNNYQRVNFIENQVKGGFDFHNIDEHLGHSYYQQLQAAALRHDTTVKHLCFAAYAYVIYMMSYGADLLVGITSNTRPVAVDGEQLLGCFLNTIPVRVNVPQNITWSEYIRLVDRKLVELKRYDNISLTYIMNITGEKSGEGNPFFDTKFNFIDFHVIKELRDEASDPGGGSLNLDNFINENTLFDFHVNNTWQTLLVSLSYSRLSVKEETARKAFGYFKQLLNLFIKEPQGKANKSAVMSEDETSWLDKFNNTDQNYNIKQAITGYLAKQVKAQPDATALVYGDEALTYAFVDTRTNQLARIIKKKKPSVPVIPILLPRSLDFVLAITAIMKSGNAYLPLDPAHPAARIQYFLEDSAVQWVITNSEWKHLIPEGFGMIYADSRRVQKQSGRSLAQRIALDTPAYMIYTSGSTGNPKGVLIEHRSLMNRLWWMQEQYRIAANDIILQKTPSIFDVSVWELCLWMITGSRLCLLEPGLEKDPDELIRAINRHKVTILHFVPSMLTYFSGALENSDGNIKTVRQIFASGEALEIYLAAQLKSLRHKFQGRLSNLYGPTEACIDVSYFDVDEMIEEKIPIGYPIANIRLYVLDSELHVQPIDAEGELCIAGIGTGRGYLNKVELTAEKFIRHKTLGSRMYRTGDRARWDEKGRLIYLGRKDDQVKIRGIRIELGEIENEMLKITGMKAAVVLSTKDASGNACLHAYYVAVRLIPSHRIREQLAAVLPSYMVPVMVQVGMIPVTQSGKVDKKALLSLEIAPTHLESVELPSTAMEKKVAQIWSSVLGRDEIGLDEELFSIGGDSFKALHILNKLKPVVGKEVHIKNVFMYPTIRTFAEFLLNLKS